VLLSQAAGFSYCVDHRIHEDSRLSMVRGRYFRFAVLGKINEKKYLTTKHKRGILFLGEEIMSNNRTGNIADSSFACC
jgi:hypothetical protein